MALRNSIHESVPSLTKAKKLTNSLCNVGFLTRKLPGAVTIRTLPNVAVLAHKWYLEYLNNVTTADIHEEKKRTFGIGKV